MRFRLLGLGLVGLLNLVEVGNGYLSWELDIRV